MPSENLVGMPNSLIHEDFIEITQSFIQKNNQLSMMKMKKEAGKVSKIENIRQVLLASANKMSRDNPLSEFQHLD